MPKDSDNYAKSVVHHTSLALRTDGVLFRGPWVAARHSVPSPTTHHTTHKLLGTAAVLGFLFILLHSVTVTVLVTLLADGAAWGTPAWSMNITGYLAGAGFAFLCRDASNKAI